VICFFADHGDHLGDHHAWQKESFFEQSCHVPFLVSWPASLPANVQRDDLVCLTDLFGIATHAAGATEVREGVDVLGLLDGTLEGRACVIGTYGEPGTSLFKAMVRDNDWKYIYMANGEREQLFDMRQDTAELHNLAPACGEIVCRMRERVVEACRVPGAADALEGDALRAFPYRERERNRIYQFDRSRGVTGFPDRPEDVLLQS
jgi:choline-sulfatase